MLASLILGLLMTTPTAAEDQVVLDYYERPPFMATEADGSVSGLTAKPAAMLFEKAGVPFRWQKTPAKRQLSEIEDNTGPDCGVGWFFNAERAGFGEFIGPIYQDRPPVVLVGPGFPVDPYKPIERLLAEAKPLVLVKDGLSYGGYIARLIQQAQLNTQRVTAEQAQMITMLAADRAGAMFSTREEADLLLAGKSVPAEKIRVIDLAADVAGEARYLLCSKRVDPKIILALKAALTS